MSCGRPVAGEPHLGLPARDGARAPGPARVAGRRRRPLRGRPAVHARPPGRARAHGARGPAHRRHAATPGATSPVSSSRSTTSCGAACEEGAGPHALHAARHHLGRARGAAAAAVIGTALVGLGRLAAVRASPSRRSRCSPGARSRRTRRSSAASIDGHGTPDRVIALTFDDGPSAETTPGCSTMLRDAERPGDVLRARAARRRASRSSSRRSAPSGHQVASHGYDHALLTFATTDQVTATARARRDRDRATRRATDPDAVLPRAARLPQPLRAPGGRGARLPRRRLDEGRVGHREAGRRQDRAAARSPGFRPGAILLLHDGDGSGAGRRSLPDRRGRAADRRRGPRRGLPVRHGLRARRDRARAPGLALCGSWSPWRSWRHSSSSGCASSTSARSSRIDIAWWYVLFALVANVASVLAKATVWKAALDTVPDHRAHPLPRRRPGAVHRLPAEHRPARAARRDRARRRAAAPARSTAGSTSRPSIAAGTVLVRAADDGRRARDRAGRDGLRDVGAELGVPRPDRARRRARDPSRSRSRAWRCSRAIAAGSRPTRGRPRARLVGGGARRDREHRPRPLGRAPASSATRSPPASPSLRRARLVAHADRRHLLDARARSASTRACRRPRSSSSSRRSSSCSRSCRATSGRSSSRSPTRSRRPTTSTSGRAIAFSIGLQVIEAALATGLGFVFLSREGLSFAEARRLPARE